MVNLEATTDANLPRLSASGVTQGNDEDGEALVPLPKESSSGANWMEIGFNWEQGGRGAVPPVHSEADKGFHVSLEDLRKLEQNNEIVVDLETKLRIGFAIMDAAHNHTSVPPPPPRDALDHMRSCHGRVESIASAPKAKASKRSVRPKDDPNRKRTGKEKKRSKSFENLNTPSATPEEETFSSMKPPDKKLNKLTSRPNSSGDLRGKPITSPAEPNRKRASKEQKRSKSFEDLSDVSKASKKDRSEETNRPEDHRSSFEDANDILVGPRRHSNLEEIRKKGADRARKSRSSDISITTKKKTSDRRAKDEKLRTTRSISRDGGDSIRGGSDHSIGSRLKSARYERRMAGQSPGRLEGKKRASGTGSEHGQRERMARSLSPSRPLNEHHLQDGDLDAVPLPALGRSSSLGPLFDSSTRSDEPSLKPPSESSLGGVHLRTLSDTPMNLALPPTQEPDLVDKEAAAPGNIRRMWDLRNLGVLGTPRTMTRKLLAGSTPRDSTNRLAVSRSLGDFLEAGSNGIRTVLQPSVHTNHVSFDGSDSLDSLGDANTVGLETIGGRSLFGGRGQQNHQADDDRSVHTTKSLGNLLMAGRGGKGRKQSGVSSASLRNALLGDLGLFNRSSHRQSTQKEVQVTPRKTVGGLGGAVGALVSPGRLTVRSVVVDDASKGDEDNVRLLLQDRTSTSGYRSTIPAGPPDISGPNTNSRFMVRPRLSGDDLSLSEHVAPLSGGGCNGAWSSSSEHGTSRSTIRATRKQVGPLGGILRNGGSSESLKSMEADLTNTSMYHKSPKIARMGNVDSTIKKSNSYGDLIPAAPVGTPTSLARRRRNKTGSCSRLVDHKGASLGDCASSSSRQQNATFGKLGSQESTEQRRAEVRQSLFSCFDEELDKDFLDFLKGAPPPPAASPPRVAS